MYTAWPFHRLKRFTGCASACARKHLLSAKIFLVGTLSQNFLSGNTVPKRPIPFHMNPWFSTCAISSGAQRFHKSLIKTFTDLYATQFRILVHEVSAWQNRPLDVFREKKVMGQTRSTDLKRWLLRRRFLSDFERFPLFYFAATKRHLFEFEFQLFFTHSCILFSRNDDSAILWSNFSNSLRPTNLICNLRGRDSKLFVPGTHKTLAYYVHNTTKTGHLT